MSKISEQINEYEAETQSEIAKQKYVYVDHYIRTTYINAEHSFHYSMTLNFIIVVSALCNQVAKLSFLFAR